MYRRFWICELQFSNPLVVKCLTVFITQNDNARQLELAGVVVRDIRCFACCAHSLRSDFTGLAKAAFTLWKLTVKNAMSTAPKPAPTNIHH